MMKSHKDIVLASKEACTGCGACASVCPQGCIRMEEGFLGHLFPVIDTSKCVGCKKCSRVCIVLRPMPLFPIRKSYALWSKDEEEYLSSASGGLASVLSRYVIRHNGSVYGCAMLPDIDVKHIRVDRLEDLNLLKSSKYVHSSILEIIPLLRKDVEKGKLVLFIGTPCQVAAIKGLFQSQPDNLFLVDLICHGVPSLKSLQKHVHKVAPSTHYDNILFREKGELVLIVVSEGRELYRMPLFSSRYHDWYYNTFIDGYTYRDSCYQCRYACPERIGDITIGDYWGLGVLYSAEIIPAHPYGCSLALPSSDKGQELLNSVLANTHYYERTIKEAIIGNAQLQRPVKKTKRIRFYRDVQKCYSFPRLYYIVNLDRIIKESFKQRLFMRKKN